jgi:putative SOS response-associated peptidase YedK
MARWGLIRFWMKQKPKVPHINARYCPSVASVPRSICQTALLNPRNRVSDGKQPYRFRRKDLEPFAGIWEFTRLNGEKILSAAMIVGDPNPLVGGVHDRMPVMLLPEDYDAWLGRTASPEQLRGLLRPYDEK